MDKHRRLHVVAIAVIALAFTACATSKRTPPTPIASVAAIAGIWTGTLDFGAGCTLTIEPSGVAQIVGQTMTATGRVAVREGAGTYDFPARSSGSLTLWATGSKRELVLKGTSGSFEAYLNPKQ